MTFVLNDEYLEKFEKIFRHLEDESATLGISTFGCSISTLEEVFLKVGVDEFQNDQNTNNLPIKASNAFTNFTAVSRGKLIWNQILAMILKKIHFMRRNVSPYIYLTLITIAILCVVLFVPINQSTPIPFSLGGLIQTENLNQEVVQKYQSNFINQNLEVTELEPSKYIRQNFIRRNLKYLIGVSFDQDPVLVWFDPFAYNSLRFFSKFLSSSGPSKWLQRV